MATQPPLQFLRIPADIVNPPDSALQQRLFATSPTQEQPRMVVLPISVYVEDYSFTAPSVPQTLPGESATPGATFDISTTWTLLPKAQTGNDFAQMVDTIIATVRPEDVTTFTLLETAGLHMHQAYIAEYAKAVEQCNNLLDNFEVNETLQLTTLEEEFKQYITKKFQEQYGDNRDPSANNLKTLLFSDIKNRNKLIKKFLATKEKELRDKALATTAAISNQWQKDNAKAIKRLQDHFGNKFRLFNYQDILTNIPYPAHHNFENIVGFLALNYHLGGKKPNSDSYEEKELERLFDAVRRVHSINDDYYQNGFAIRHDGFAKNVEKRASIITWGNIPKPIRDILNPYRPIVDSESRAYLFEECALQVLWPFNVQIHRGLASFAEYMFLHLFQSQTEQNIIGNEEEILKARQSITESSILQHIFSLSTSDQNTCNSPTSSSPLPSSSPVPISEQETLARAATIEGTDPFQSSPDQVTYTLEQQRTPDGHATTREQVIGKPDDVIRVIKALRAGNRQAFFHDHPLNENMISGSAQIEQSNLEITPSSPGVSS